MSVRLADKPIVEPKVVEEKPQPKATKGKKK